MEKNKIDWEKVVADSNGASMFLPEKFFASAQEVKKRMDEYNEQVGKMAKLELSMNMANQTMFFELRKWFEENGRPDIWQKDIGFNTAAFDEGKFVVNLSDPRPR